MIKIESRILAFLLMLGIALTGCMANFQQALSAKAASEQASPSQSQPAQARPDLAKQELASASSTVSSALDDLQQLAEGLARFVPAEHLYFDLTELRGFRYHTGVVFAAYVPGLGHAIAKGGRYDHIGKAYGRARPATGFSLDLIQALSLSSQSSMTTYGIYAPAQPDDAELHGNRKKLVVCMQRAPLFIQR